MTKRSSVRVLAGLIAGAVLLTCGGAYAQDRFARRTQADCDRIRAEYQQADRKEKEQLDIEKSALAEAQKAADTADKIRTMTEWERVTTLSKAEGELEKLKARRIEEFRGQAVSELDPWIIKLEVFVAALKDAKMRAEEASASGGLLSSDRNSLDAFAKQLRGRAAKAKEQAADWARRSETGRRTYQDCLTELQQKRGALDDEDDQYASAAGADDYDDYDEAYAGGSPGGYDDSIGSDAYPPRPSVRPPRVRPARSDRWTGSDGYDGPVDMRPDRRARRDGWRDDARRGDRVRGDGRRGDRTRADRGQREDRRGGKGGGKRNKGGKGGQGQSNCHTNPLTGQQHCGDG